MLGIRRYQIPVKSLRMLSAFAGKGREGNAWATLVAQVVLRTGRAVRVKLECDLDIAWQGNITNKALTMLIESFGKRSDCGEPPKQPSVSEVRTAQEKRAELKAAFW